MTTDYHYDWSAFNSVTNELSPEMLSDSIWTSNVIVKLLLSISVYIDSTYPNGTVKFTFQNALDNSEKTELDTIVDTHLGIPDLPSTIDRAKQEAKAAIDNAAGDARSRYITVSPGQDAVYIAKGKEAEDYIAAAYPADDSPYPYIVAEKNAKSITSQAAADGIKAIADQWTVLAASIEELRLNYKEQIDAAIDIDVIAALKGKGIALLNTI